MADVTLGDYAGYLFVEMVRARELADEYSRTVAHRYRDHPELTYFSVPRFKVPRIDLTAPVLVSGARFSTVVRFRMPLEEFLSFISGRVASALRSIEVGMVRPGTVVVLPPVFQPQGPKELPKARETVMSPKQQSLAEDFHQQLVANTDPAHPESLVLQQWPQLLRLAIEEAALTALYQKHYPNDELVTSTTKSVLETVQVNTVIDRTSIDSLLVNPETQTVKDGSSDASVFVIKAELVEEGFYIRSMTDEQTGQQRPVVEFD